MICCCSDSTRIATRFKSPTQIIVIRLFAIFLAYQSKKNSAEQIPKKQNIGEKALAYIKIIFCQTVNFGSKLLSATL
jgi:hypothetical protein